MAALNAIIGYGLAASRPAAGVPGRLFYASDTNTLSRDAGSTWDTLTPGGGGSALTIEEVDGSPTDSAVTKLVLPNGTLAIASHVATYTPPAFAAVALRNSGAVTVTNNTSPFVVVAWDTEDFDTHAFHSTGSNTERITIPSGQDGYYQFGALVPWPGNGGGGWRVQQLHLNGTTEVVRVDWQFNANDRRAQIVSQPIALVAGDYVTVIVYQDSGGSLNLLAGEGRFWAHKIG